MPECYTMSDLAIMLSFLPSPALGYGSITVASESCRRPTPAAPSTPHVRLVSAQPYLSSTHSLWHVHPPCRQTHVQWAYSPVNREVRAGQHRGVDTMKSVTRVPSAARCLLRAGM